VAVLTQTRPTPEPNRPTPTQPPVQGIRRPTRRLVNPSLFVTTAAPRPSYRDVIMAGGDVGRRGGRGAPRHGAPSDRSRGRGRGLVNSHGREENQGRGREETHSRDHGRDRGRGGRGGPPRPVVALPRLVVAVALPRLVVVALTEVAATTLGQCRGLSILLARRTPGGTPGPIAHTLRSPSRVPRKLVTPGESKSKARWWTMSRARRGRGRIHQ